jgi:hypothetical protein
VAKTMKDGATMVRKLRSTKHQPSHEEIAFRAYQIYLERGGCPGNEFEDWTRAERELAQNGVKTRRRVAKAQAV